MEKQGSIYTYSTELVEHHSTDLKRQNSHCSECSKELREVFLFGGFRLFRADSVFPLPSGYFSAR